MLAALYLRSNHGIVGTTTDWRIRHYYAVFIRPGHQENVEAKSAGGEGLASGIDSNRTGCPICNPSDHGGVVPSYYPFIPSSNLTICYPLPNKWLSLKAFS